MSMPMKLSFETLPDPFVEPENEKNPWLLEVSHIITIGDKHSIHVLQTTCPDAVSDWFSRLDATTGGTAGEIVAGLNLFTEKYDSNSKTHLALIVLCVGSSCLFYYNRFSTRFCSGNTMMGHGVAGSLVDFCARPGVKLVCTGQPKGVRKLAKCGLEFGQPPVMQQQLVERRLLGGPVKLGEETGDAVTTAIWGRPVILGEMAGNTHDDRWTGSSFCEFVLNAYIASEVGTRILLPP